MVTKARREIEVVVTLKAYLREIEAEELRKPAHERRAVPSISELARAVGIHEITLINFVNGHARRLNLETAHKIISVMRARGFQMEVSDLVDWTHRRPANPPGGNP